MVAVNEETLELGISPEKSAQYKKCIRASKAFSSKIKIKRPTKLKKILRNRYQSRSVYYFTCDRDINKDPTHQEAVIQKFPYAFPIKIDDFSYRTKYKKENEEMRERSRLYNYKNRPNYRSRLNNGKLERLHIPLTDSELPGKSVTENVDPEFFTLVSGKPIREKFNINLYLKNLRDLFLIRLQIGFKYDETYLMEEMHIEEKKRLAEIRKKFAFYSECYDKFLAEDHTSSLLLLKSADEETKKSKVKREKIRNLLRDCGWYRTKILILDEQWRIARLFQKFLYQISPLWWRNKYDFIHKSRETGGIDTSNTSLYGRGGGSMTSVPSIITIIDQFIEDIAKAEPPTLYFKEPAELLHIFQELERNNLLALLQCEELTQPAQQMSSGLEKARQLFTQEVNILREHLKSLEDEVVFEESRSRECELKAKSISLGLFRDLIVDRYTLNLYVNVEDCFETCVAQNDSNLPLTIMMKGIEYTQETLMFALDKLPNDIVLNALHTCYLEDAKTMKEAHEATKMIIQIENLMKTLRKSLEPRQEGRMARKLVRRSEPPVEKMEKVTQAKALSKEQLEYLYFFTDFCYGTGDPEVGRLLCAQKSGTKNVMDDA